MLIDSNNLKDIDVAILAGGLGTRVQEILGDTPKILAPIGGVPFLDYILSGLARAKAAHVVLCLGHLAEKVKTYIDCSKTKIVKVTAVVEKSPLGTAGAIRLAAPLLLSETIMIMNGDTWLDIDLEKFVFEHKKSGAGISMICTEAKDCSQFGRVEVNSDGNVTRFVEKDTMFNGSALINGGFYLFERSAFDRLIMSTGPSLEHDFLATDLGTTIHAFVDRQAPFIDIGTPENLEAANDFFS
ncbi:MAG: D-glycero-alpha-D-manno-heptose 1-phosphate guanylyltransferase [Alphaproteobacteria bacterium MarineAlpha3_Bin5]|nr:nucleotidyl transferase [Magnetovibrio sp.]PPR77238.1 MAG: D-glycero-alpha-D-manno-heptose 1-phosphate guanylyltransferase [Alphaproteobacteria bacterium MarineAlpha3_Bin5]